MKIKSLLFALIAIQLGGCATDYSNEKIRDALRASCNDAVFFYSRLELKEIVKNDFEKRGGSFGTDWRVDVRVKRCEYEVFVVQVPERPGGFFSVFVSSITGKITGHFAGM